MKKKEWGTTSGEKIGCNEGRPRNELNEIRKRSRPLEAKRWGSLIAAAPSTHISQERKSSKKAQIKWQSETTATRTTTTTRTRTKTTTNDVIVYEGGKTTKKRKRKKIEKEREKRRKKESDEKKRESDDGNPKG